MTKQEHLAKVLGDALIEQDWLDSRWWTHFFVGKGDFCVPVPCREACLAIAAVGLFGDWSMVPWRFALPSFSDLYAESEFATGMRLDQVAEQLFGLQRNTYSSGLRPDEQSESDESLRTRCLARLHMRLRCDNAGAILRR